MSHSIRTTPIVFSQDDTEDSAPFAMLHRHDGTIESYMPTVESIIATAQHLSQWDYGEDHEVEVLPPTDAHHERYFIRPDRDENEWIVYTDDWALLDSTPQAGDYVLTEHPRMGYVSLDRIVSIRKEPTEMRLDWVKLVASDDPLKGDLEVTCLGCGTVLFDAQDDDTLLVLVEGFRDHVETLHRGVKFVGVN